MTEWSAFLTLLVLLASYLMLNAGMAKRRMAWRDPHCPVCGHARSRCTCHWL
ncbi:MAG TPA: hypothetical protein VJP39_01225 [Gaiellaceae bacterium]|nr:hypothetical protein [Gaiellaceae bacterium]